MQQLIRCINCNEVYLRTPFDTLPQYDLSCPSETIEKDDYRNFLQSHQGHRLEDLSIIEDSFVSEKDYREPVKTAYFRATNGKERFVIKKSRDRIDEPLKYEVISGDYSLTCLSLSIQEREIEKQLAAEFKQRPFSKEKVNAFIKTVKRIAENASLRDLERACEESPNPLEMYYKMDEVSIVTLQRNCRHLFKGEEYSDIEAFIEREKQDGVLLLKAIYGIQLSEIKASEQELCPSASRLEEKRVRAKR